MFPFFCNAVRTLYCNANSSIKLKHGTSSRFDIKRCICQGCPISPYLFLLAAQLLADHVKQSNLTGISIAGREVIISQLADDTTLFLKNSDQVAVALGVIDAFSKISGLHLNISKYELLSIMDCTISSICNILVKEKVVYLGIVITKNESTRCNDNFIPIVEKPRKKLNQRNISLKGRVLLTKAEGLSRLTYAALALHLEKKICKMLDNLLFNFVWRNHTHYIKKTVVMNTYETEDYIF